MKRKQSEREGERWARDEVRQVSGGRSLRALKEVVSPVSEAGTWAG